MNTTPRNRQRAVTGSTMDSAVSPDGSPASAPSSDPSQYLKRMRQRDPQLSEAFKGGVPPLALPFTTAGGTQNVLCWDTEGVFRLLQSIPSPKTLAKPSREKRETMTAWNDARPVEGCDEQRAGIGTSLRQGGRRV